MTRFIISRYVNQPRNKIFRSRDEQILVGLFLLFSGEMPVALDPTATTVAHLTMRAPPKFGLKNR